MGRFRRLDEVTVEYKSLVVGILFSIGVFALKSGLGVYYLFGRRRSAVSAAGILAAFAGGYLALFWGIFWFLKQVNLLEHLEAMQSFFQSGMGLHFLMALLMTVWGISLLKERPKDKPGWGWAAMVVPCPVCLSVILLSLSFTLAAYPDAGTLPVWGLYGLFMGMAFLAAVTAKWVEKWLATNPEAILGAAMATIAAYFFLSVIVLPHVGELDEIYRLANRTGSGPIHSNMTILAGWGCVVAAFLVGFGWMQYRIRRLSTWISPHS